MKNDVLYEGALTNGSRKAINHNVADNSVTVAEIDITTSTTGATLVNVPELVTDSTHQLDAGATYQFDVHLSTISTANGGIKVAFAQTNGLTLTSLESISNAKNTGTADVKSHVTSTTTGASLVATTTAIQEVDIKGTFVAKTGGTLQLQIAQNVAHADTTSLYVGSYMTVRRISPIDTIQ